MNFRSHYGRDLPVINLCHFQNLRIVCQRHHHLNSHLDVEFRSLHFFFFFFIAAVKVNDIRVVIETLMVLGAGFDCASIGEIMKVLSLGVSPDRIIFANPTKTTSQIKYACKEGITKMTFDSEDELYKIKNIHPKAE